MYVYSVGHCFIERWRLPENAALLIKAHRELSITLSSGSRRHIPHHFHRNGANLLIDICGVAQRTHPSIIFRRAQVNQLVQFQRSTSNKREIFPALLCLSFSHICSLRALDPWCRGSEKVLSAFTYPALYLILVIV